jgi:outer membrane autotransporter protein
LSPSAGYFIIDNLAVGAAIDFNASSTKPSGGTGKSSSTSVSLSPFVRYYLNQGIFFQGQVGFGSENSKYPSGGGTTTTTKYSTSNWSLGAGYAYFLNDFVAVEPMIGYGSNSQKTTSGPDVKYSYPGLFLKVGFQVYLGARN